MSPKAYDDYDEATTALCERALVTLLGDVGPWGERMYLVGGLAPRYLVGQLPEGAAPHVGTTDLDLVIGIALGDSTPETYRTLENNLRTRGFTQEAKSFQWTRVVSGATVIVEFLCETDEVEAGRIFKPKNESVGSKMGAFNVPGAGLVVRDHRRVWIEAGRLDAGGLSRVELRVAEVLSYTVLKILAFQDRHENKDVYDLIFVLFNADGGPVEAGRRARTSAVAGEPQVHEALILLGQRFADIDQDGPVQYAAFLASSGDDGDADRLRQEAVATVRAFLTGFGVLG